MKTEALVTRDFAREEEVADLKRQIADLKSRPVLKDANVWRPGATYEPGDCVTWGGSAWICTAAHVSNETVDHACFRLFVKRGRDGRAGH